MKLSFKLITLLIVISFVACKNKNNQNGEAKTEYAEAGKDDANDIIEYNNVLVSLTDKNNDYLKRLDGNLTRISKGLENPTDRFAFTAIIPPFDTPNVNMSKFKSDTPPSALNNSDQSYFKENVAGLTTTLNKIKETYKSLDNYIRAEDFKDDKGTKGRLLIDSIYAMSEKYYVYDDKILAKLESIGDDAERIILKSHPLKEYIFALKDDKKAVADFNKLLTETKDYKAIEVKVKSAYEHLEAQNKKHAAMEAPDAKKYPGRDYTFKRFNDSFSEYLIEVRKIMRDAASSGRITKSDVDNLYSKQDNMRTAYNNFVD